MRLMPKRRKPSGPQPVPLPSRLDQALHRLYPGGRVELDVLFDETYLADLAPRLRHKLARIPDAILTYEQPPESGARKEQLFDATALAPLLRDGKM